MITYEQLEKMRKSLRNKYICLTLLITVLILFFIFVLNLAFFDLFNLKIFLIVCLVYIIMFTFINKIRKTTLDSEYKLAFKNYFVRTLLSRVFTNLDYQVNKGIDYSLIASTKMIKMGSIYNSNDLVTGSYKNIKFMQSDIDVSDRYTDSDGDTHYVNIFKGRWMIFDFNKNFKSNVQVCQNGFFNNNIDLSVYKKLKHIEMESSVFNDKFFVYAENELDAFYILTPKMMERIMTLDNLNSGKLILCFVENKLHVGICNDNDSFEPGSVFKKINQENVINYVVDDIKRITMFIDILELDNDLFKID